MTDQQTSTPAPAPPAKSRWGRIASIAFGVVVVVLGGVKLLDFFVLPGCDATRITDTVRDIFKSKDVELAKLEQIKTIAEEPTKMCGAYIESADEKATIEYSVTWQGWSPFVKIEKVDSIATESAPAPAPTEPAPAPAQ